MLQHFYKINQPAIQVHHAERSPGARLKAGMTQARLAEKLGIRQNMISDYECGRRTYSDAMAGRLSKALNVREEHLRYGSEPPES